MSNVWELPESEIMLRRWLLLSRVLYDRYRTCDSSGHRDPIGWDNYCGYCYRHREPWDDDLRGIGQIFDDFLNGLTLLNEELGDIARSVA